MSLRCRALCGRREAALGRTLPLPLVPSAVRRTCRHLGRLPAGNVVWSSGAPDTFNSSEDVTRRFCGACGTPLSYESTRWPDELHILVATLDDPESLTPTAHVSGRNISPGLRWTTA